jgi:hypothetical protein
MIDGLESCCTRLETGRDNGVLTLLCNSQGIAYPLQYLASGFVQPGHQLLFRAKSDPGQELSRSGSCFCDMPG